jgi:hypothetical protein
VKIVGKNPRVVGLDLSMTATGVCDGDGARTVKPASRDGDRRLMQIVAELRPLCYGADLVVIEDLPTHAHSAGITGMVHGAVRHMLLSGPPYVTVPPASLKKFATGRGNCGKPEMAVALFKRAGLELGDSDQVDAWWLRAAGHQLLGDPLVELPAAQVAALDKLAEAVTCG